MSKKATSRQYSTNEHDNSTLTLEEYRRLNSPGLSRKDNKSKRVYLHKSTYAGEGEKVW